jgi:hypothetical protein
MLMLFLRAASADTISTTGNVQDCGSAIFKWEFLGVPLLCHPLSIFLLLDRIEREPNLSSMILSQLVVVSHSSLDRVSSFGGVSLFGLQLVNIRWGSLRRICTISFEQLEAFDGHFAKLVTRS